MEQAELAGQPAWAVNYVSGPEPVGRNSKANLAGDWADEANAATG